MNRPIRRAGWVKFALLLLVLGSGTGGLYLATMGSDVVPLSPNPEKGSSTPSDDVPKPHRFSLTKLDAKDTVEAPALATDAAGRIYLAWGSKTGAAERTVFFTASADRGKSFDTPRTINQAETYLSGARTTGKASGHERRATPHVVVDGAAIHLAWAEALPGGKSIRMVLATSTDGGRTFSPKRPVHQDPRANATFVAMTLGANGSLACSWLDDRDGAQLPYAAVRRPGAEWFEEERLLHTGENGKGVCPCCATAACVAPDGTVFVAFRNIQNGYRDIFVSRLRPGQSTFDGPFPITPNTWEFKGCPHDGPSLAVVGDALHVVWMDAHTGPARCYHARALLADMKFEVKPLHAAGPGTQGNAKLFADSNGGLHAVWEESLGAEKKDVGHQHAPPRGGAGDGRAVQYAYLAPGQSAFNSAKSVAAKPGAFQSRPAVVATSGGDLWAAWNELDESGKSVVVTRLPWRSDRP